MSQSVRQPHNHSESNARLTGVIELTPVAATKLLELRVQAADRPYLRLYVAGRSCCSYQYGLALDDKVDAADAVSEVNGIPVAVDPTSQPFCDGATIDYVDTPEGSGFIVTNRSLGGSCGCGGR